MRRAVAVGAVIIASLVTTSLKTITASAAPKQAPVVASLQSCLQDSHKLFVLNLIDESGSLQQTDPTAERVVGVKAELAGLARLAETPIDGKRVDVEVRLTNFATGYRALWSEKPNRPEWRKVDNASLPGLLATTSLLANRDQGQDTDYVTALQHALNDFASKSAEATRQGGAPPCQALVWFTDGRYDLTPRVTAAERAAGLTVSYAPHLPLTTSRAAARAMAIGRKVMCANNGLIDQLRENQIKIFTVALNQQLEPSASAFLRAASVGGASPRCGRHGRADSGMYLLASQDSQLLFLFSSLFDTPASVRFCPAPGQLSCVFATVAGLSSFSLEVATPKSADRIVLTGPSGVPVQLSPSKPRTPSVSGAPVTAEWFSPQTAEIDADLPDSSNAWVGKWHLAFLDPSGNPSGRGTYALRLRANLYPAPTSSLRVTLGKPASVELGFVNALGHPVPDSPLIRNAALHASLVDLDTGESIFLPVTRKGVGAWATRFTPSATARGIPHLALRLAGVFAPIAGVALTTEARQVSLTLLPPPSYPTIAESNLQLPSVRGTRETQGTLTILGPAHGTGCVWATASPVALAQHTNIATLTLVPLPDSSVRCLRVAAGQKRVIRVVARPRTQGSGRAAGMLQFHLVGTSGHSLEEPIPVSFDMRLVPNAARAIALFVGLLIAGLVLPLLLLMLLNWRGARFAPPQLLRYLARDVELSPSGELTAPGGEPLDASPAAFELVANEARVAPTRSLALDGDRFRFVARAFGARGERIPSLVLGPYGVVETESGVAAAGTPGLGLRSFPKAGRHEVPLALAGTWVFDPDPMQLADPQGSGIDLGGDSTEAPKRVRGRLLLLAPSDAAHEGARLVLAATQRLIQDREALLAEVSGRVAQVGRLRTLLDRWHTELKREPGVASDDDDPEVSKDDLFETRL